MARAILGKSPHYPGIAWHRHPKPRRQLENGQTYRACVGYHPTDRRRLGGAHLYVVKNGARIINLTRSLGADLLFACVKFNLKLVKSAMIL